MLTRLYTHAMKYPDSVSGSRIQKYQKYISLLKAYEKKSNSLRSDSAFFSYNAKNYTQVLLQILSSNPEPDISDISSTCSHTSLLSFSPHIVNIKVLASGAGRFLTCSRAFAAPRSGKRRRTGIFYREHRIRSALQEPCKFLGVF